ncbi:MAG: peroxiredoxin [Gammaproteobacteria bacterium]
MPLSPGDRIPAVQLFHFTSDGPAPISSEALFGSGTCVAFALPGAFTPTCSQAHLPGYVVRSDALAAAGVDRIICLSVNDAFVMHAWGREHNADDRVLMVADGNADFARAMGLDVDLSARGMGIRSQRYAMIVRDGTIEHLNVEAPGQFAVSDAQTMLGLLGAN